VLWILLCVALVLFALVVWSLIGLRLWRKTKVVTRDLQTATRQLETISASLSELGGSGTQPELAEVAAAGSRRHAAPGRPMPAGAEATPPQWDVRRQGRRTRGR
jgi:hypothetical protein